MMPHRLRALLATLVLATSAQAAGQAQTPPAFRYVAILDYPAAHFPYADGPGRVTVLVGRSNASADDARAQACADMNRHLMTVKANRGAGGWESVMGAPYEAALKIAEDAVAACTSPDNGIACPSSRFLATAIAQEQGEVAFRAAGAACSGQSIAAAEKSALARCNQARQRKGVAAPCKTTGRSR